MQSRRMYRIVLFLVLGMAPIHLAQNVFAETEVADVYPVPENHLRIVTWNLEVFNLRNQHPVHSSNPNGPRTDAQLRALASRILGFRASIIGLQEMNDVSALHDLRRRMNGEEGEDGPWKVFPASAESSQQNALLYDATKVEAVSIDFVSSTPFGGDYPSEASYRSPVTAVFAPKGNSSQKFRVICIHGSWQGEEICKQQGKWLAAYLADLMMDEDETRRIVLLGDMNGIAESGHAPHDGIISSGVVRYVPKQNGEVTAIDGNRIDSFYVSDSVKDRLANASSLVIRHDFFDETIDEFRKTCSDHFPVFVDYANFLQDGESDR